MGRNYREETGRGLSVLVVRSRTWQHKQGTIDLPFALPKVGVNRLAIDRA